MLSFNVIVKTLLRVSPSCKVKCSSLGFIEPVEFGTVMLIVGSSESMLVVALARVACPSFTLVIVRSAVNELSIALVNSHDNVLITGALIVNCFLFKVRVSDWKAQRTMT